MVVHVPTCYCQVPIFNERLMKGKNEILVLSQYSYESYPLLVRVFFVAGILGYFTKKEKLGVPTILLLWIQKIPPSRRVIGT